MTAGEQGFLLLSSQLGDSSRCPLSTAQLRTLTQRIRQSPRPTEDRDLTPEDLISLGYSREMAERIVLLLGDRPILEHYLHRAKQADCHPFTRVTPGYPSPLLNRLGPDAPGCLWLKGNPELLQKPCISLVGSRDIRRNNLIFAQEVGRQAAKQGYVLVSGNARGADRAAQLACLQAGGQIICVVADELTKRHHAENVLCISEDCFDAPFSALRALSRNRLIHCLSDRVFVAQCDNGHGGTWDGTARNLKSGWSRVFCFQDGSDACSELMQMGAEPIDLCNLYNFSSLSLPDSGLFGQ